MKRRISESLSIESDHVCCDACGRAITAAGSAWKPMARLQEIPLRSIPGMGTAVSGAAVLRQFFCPGCGVMLDTEVALPDDPFLTDIVTP